MSLNEGVTAVVEYERRRRGWTRSELARQLGAERAWVTRKLNGYRQWSLDDLEQLAAHLDVPLAGLLERAAGSIPSSIRRAVVHLTRRYGSRLAAGAAAGAAA